ncbi:hypothetical protein ACHQM5_016081 [Ranunculus cassubicifolius]
MAYLLKLFTIFLIFANLLFFATEARILKETRVQTHGSIDISGPIPRGDHHKSINVQTLGAVKDSGPSPGTGHSYVDVHNLGGIKDSGPSPGGGHSFVTEKHN